MTKPLLDSALLHQLLRYEPDTGRFFWRERPASLFEDSKQSASHKAGRWNARYADKEALTADNGCGYKYGAIFNVHYKAHRIAWVMANGKWPDETVDHINGNPSDNRLCNLRSATRSENQWNRRNSKTSTSGYLGVSWDARLGKWKAQITVARCNKALGHFDNEVSAAQSYDNAARRVHGVFASLNFKDLAA